MLHFGAKKHEAGCLLRLVRGGDTQMGSHAPFLLSPTQWEPSRKKEKKKQRKWSRRQNKHSLTVATLMIFFVFVLIFRTFSMCDGLNQFTLWFHNIWQLCVFLHESRPIRSFAFQWVRLRVKIHTVCRKQGWERAYLEPCDGLCPDVKAARGAKTKKNDWELDRPFTELC